jgi:RNA 3'-terminal phosphate cyclase
MNDWLAIDGAYGERGGQILRTSLALPQSSDSPFIWSISAPAGAILASPRNT